MDQPVGTAQTDSDGFNEFGLFKFERRGKSWALGGSG